jgi:hypothetical protein
MEDNNKMDTLSECMEHLRKHGYDKEFLVREGKLTTPDGEMIWSPAQVKITQFYRFEGESDPADMQVLYAVECEDGTKGTITDGFGTYASADVSNFVRKIEEIHKYKVY